MTDKGKFTAETEAPKNRSRRKAVKTIVGGVGALAAYHTLPVNWSTPIIEQVFLPAHAQTSGIVPAEQPDEESVPAETTQPPQPISSSPSDITVTQPNTDVQADLDTDIFITFNGGSTLLLDAIAEPYTTPDDAIIGFDSDPGVALFDIYGSGSNWSITNNGGLSGSANSPNTYTIGVSGYGSNYSLTFTVDVTVGVTNTTMTVSNVSIIETP